MSTNPPVSKAAMLAAGAVAVTLGAAAVIAHSVGGPQANPAPIVAPQQAQYPAGVLPDPKLTPGKVNPALTPQVLFAPGFTTPGWRHVTQADKDAVYRRYGLQVTPAVRQSVEVDHLIPIEVGGDNSTEDPRATDYLTNLWAEPWHVQWQGFDLGAHTKDRVENAARKAVQQGRMTLPDVQAGFAHDWTVLYHKLVGDFPKWAQ